MVKVTFKVERDMEKCKDCEHNPKNMTLILKIKNIFQSFPTVCGLCTAEEITKRIKKEKKK